MFSVGIKEKGSKPKTGLVYRIWNKCGIISLGFFGTITVGAPERIVVGMNASLQKLLTWCWIGVVTRCVIFTAIGYNGVQLF